MTYLTNNTAERQQWRTWEQAGDNEAARNAFFQYASYAHFEKEVRRVYVNTYPLTKHGLGKIADEMRKEAERRKNAWLDLV